MAFFQTVSVPQIERQGYHHNSKTKAHRADILCPKIAAPKSPAKSNPPGFILSEMVAQSSS